MHHARRPGCPVAGVNGTDGSQFHTGCRGGGVEVDPRGATES